MLLISEQVGSGHPDKICDQVSDLILDLHLIQDSRSRIAVETAIGKGILFITGEISSTAKVDIKKHVKELLVGIDPRYDHYEILLNLGVQSPEINAKVDSETHLGAGDQGLMFGYATDETESLLPIPYHYATELIKEYEAILVDREKYFADCKSQIAFNYDTNKIKNIVISVQHGHDVPLDKVRFDLNEIVTEVIPHKYVDENTEILINNGGSFICGGAFADAGVTGRKIVADTYGGASKVGGGAFSGKDPSKVDRSASYYARYVARQIVKRGFAHRIEIGIGYVIGGNQELGLNIECFGTNTIPIDSIRKIIKENFNFSVSNIISELDLLNVSYLSVATHGHFTHFQSTWEK